MAQLKTEAQEALLSRGWHNCVERIQVASAVVSTRRVYAIKPHSAYGMEIPKMDRASVSDLLHLVLLPDVPFVLHRSRMLLAPYLHPQWKAC